MASMQVAHARRKAASAALAAGRYHTVVLPGDGRALAVGLRELRKGGLVKGGLAIYALPLCNCSTLGSVLSAQIENMPNC